MFDVLCVFNVLCPVCERRTGRSVRCVLDRSDDMLITSGRHPFLGKYKVGPHDILGYVEFVVL